MPVRKLGDRELWEGIRVTGLDLEVWKKKTLLKRNVVKNELRKQPGKKAGRLGKTVNVLTELPEKRKGQSGRRLEGMRSQQPQKECRLSTSVAGQPLAMLESRAWDCAPRTKVWLSAEGVESSCRSKDFCWAVAAGEAKPSHCTKCWNMQRVW